MTNIKHVLLETSHGNIKLALNSEKAPLTVANFMSYVEKGHYDGVIFHRVIKNFMIQGGGMDINMQEKDTSASINNEANNGLKNTKGTIAMARTSDPHSASAQFFINVNNNEFLNHTSPTPSGWGYAVFGEVIDGMDIVSTIEQVKTGRSGGHQDVPVEAVVINKASIVID
jgi:peptidyl-prolyl cis-trans isomerase B (cyclophilin B)